MRITGVRAYCVPAASRDYVVVRVSTDEGIDGVGEATLRGKTAPVLACLDALAGHVTGLRVVDVEQLGYRFLTGDHWRGGAITGTAVAAVEVALWDIMGKRSGLPIHDLLGGRLREEVRLYANGWKRRRLHDTVVASAQALVAAGWRALKWHPVADPGDVQVTAEMLRTGADEVLAVREAVGPDIELMVELHGKLRLDQALPFIRAIEPARPRFVEEPLHPDDDDGYRRLAARANVPLAGGERLYTRAEHRRALAGGHLSILQPDLLRCGGIWELKKIASMAEAHGVTVEPHNSSGPIATAASLHVDATLPDFGFQETMVSVSSVASAICCRGPAIEGSVARLGDAPGLGVSVDFDDLARRAGEPPKRATDW